MEKSNNLVELGSNSYTVTHFFGLVHKLVVHVIVYIFFKLTEASWDEKKKRAFTDVE